jgi:hypothetical protein
MGNTNTTDSEYAGQPFTAIELRMQYDTLETMVGEAYRAFDELGRLHDEWGLTYDFTELGIEALAQRIALRDEYERLRGLYRATLEQYLATTTDNSYEIRSGW